MVSHEPFDDMQKSAEICERDVLVGTRSQEHRAYSIKDAEEDEDEDTDDARDGARN
jgi:hypothetical protein